MDVKITGKRLKNTLSYDWIKIIAFSLAAILVWTLAFTTGATRATEGQQFYFVVFDDVYYDSEANADMLYDMKSDGSLSYDVLKAQVNNITKAGNYDAVYMLNLRLTTGEGDVMIMNSGKSNADGGEASDGEENGEKTVTTAERVLESGYVADLLPFIDGAENYVKKFTTDGTINGEISADKVETYFLTKRVKSARNYKKTYNTDEKKAEGVKGEIERITHIKEAYLRVKSALDKAKDRGVDLYRYWEKPTAYSGNEVTERKTTAYGIDLTVLCDGATDKKELVKSWWLVDEENNATTTDGLTFCVLNCTEEDSDLQYEALTALDYVIRNYSNYAD